jgi:hypothetical protein
LAGAGKNAPIIGALLGESMNEKPKDQHIQHCSERFDRGEDAERTPEEESVLQAYRQIREELRRYPVSANELRGLSRMLKTEFHKNSYRAWMWDWTGRIFKPAFAAVALIIFSTCAYILTTPRVLPVSQISLSNDAHSSQKETPWLWRFLLQRGFSVTTPKDRPANLTLRDGSTIACAPGTRLSVQIDKERWIRLSAGEVTIHAAHIHDSTMTVETPSFNVQVIGTIFHLKVTE